MPLNIEQIRKQFPALARRDSGQLRIYLDNPAGTQVPQPVIDRITDYLVNSNANKGGHFRTSQESDAILKETYQAVADFFNAASPQEIVFGPNMTTLTYAFSRSLAHWFNPGDEIIVSRMDHDANVTPWIQMAEENRVTVKWLNFNKETYQFDLNELQDLLTDRARLVAVGYASNALGTVNDVKAISEMAHKVGALVFVDAVHYAPHGPIDVQDIECDFLVCSAYKFFGGHQGILWGKQNLLEDLPAYKVRPAPNNPPGKFETGTQSHEEQAGVLGTMEYLASIGETMAEEYHREFAHFQGRKRDPHAAMAAIRNYEKELSRALIYGLQTVPGVTIHGITGLDQLDRRVPTVTFIKEGITPEEIARRLGEQNIFVWHGHYYAVEVMNHLGLGDKGGMIRVGAVHYNTTDEIERFIDVLKTLSK